MNDRVPLADLVRAAARPVITVILAATVAQVVTQQIEAPPQFWGLAVMSIAWWFGERAIEHIRERRPPAQSAQEEDTST